MTPHALAEQLDQAITALLRRRAPEPSDPGVEALLTIAAPLVALPAAGFKERLRIELERKTLMTAATVKMPAGFRNLTPYLQTPGIAREIAFLEAAFGAEVVYRSPAPGHEHAQVRIGDSMLMLSSGPNIVARPMSLHIHIDGVDEVYRRALAAGATPFAAGTSTGEPVDHPYGERSGYVTDPAGNHWYIGERATSQIRHPQMGTVTPYMHPESAVRLIEFLERAFNAELVVRHEHEGRVAHAQARIGDSIVEMGDNPQAIEPAAYYLYVADADAAYRQALEAGATSAQPPAMQEWGDYNAWVTDPFGNHWFLAEHRSASPRKE